MVAKRSKEPTQKFRQVACRVWKVMKMRGWSDEKKLLWMYLLTGDGTNYTGIFDFGYIETAVSLYWCTRKGQPDGRRVARLMSELAEEERLIYDEKASVLLMLHWLEYKPIASRDTALGVATYLKSLPNTPLIARWFEQARLYLKEEIVHAITVAYQGGVSHHPGGEGTPEGRGDIGGDKEVRSKDKDKKYGQEGGVPPQEGPRGGEVKHILGGELDGGHRSDVSTPSSLPPAVPNPDPRTGKIRDEAPSHQEIIRIGKTMGLEPREDQNIEAFHQIVSFALKLNRTRRLPIS